VTVVFMRVQSSALVNRPVRKPALAFASLALAALACGPSFQAIYEGDARFEKCYALDESTQAPLARKSDCWADWSRRYTYGQTRDRIDYARSRRDALSRVPDLPTDESIMQAAPGGGGSGSSVTAPMPTSAFAPPPGTLAVDPKAASESAFELPAVAVATDGTAVSGPPREPESRCSSACGSAWRACGDTCKASACDACAKGYRRCMRTCFTDDGAKKRAR
jgi:hypothetical protein